MVGERQRSGGIGTGQRVDRRTALALGGATVVGGLAGPATVSRARASTHETSVDSAPEDYDAVRSEMDGDGSGSNPYVVTDVADLQAAAGDPSAHYGLGDHVDAGPTAAWNETDAIEGEFAERAHTTETQTAHAPLVEGSETVRIQPGTDGSSTTLDPSTYAVDYETGRITFPEEPGEPTATIVLDYELRDPVARGFEPIGGGDEPFAGSLDGRGYSILNPTVNRPARLSVGLFGQLSRPESDTDPQVSSLRLVDVDVSGNQETGGLVGGMFGGSIRNVTVSGSVAGRRDGVTGQFTGGLVGEHRGGAVRRSRSTATVSGGLWTGGVIGRTKTATVRQCYGTGNVSGRDDVGGFAGNVDGPVEACHATGDVSGVAGIGGFCGTVDDDGTVTRCFATGRASASSSAGGLAGAVVYDGSVQSSNATGGARSDHSTGFLVGRLSHTGTVTRSYATADDGSEAAAGGLIGTLTTDLQDEGDALTLRDCYWDVSATDTSDAVRKSETEEGSVVVENVHGLQTAEMQGSSVTETMAALDFTDTWAVPSGGSYPPLRSTAETGLDAVPVPVLTAEPQTPATGESVTLDAADSHPEGAVASYTWSVPWAAEALSGSRVRGTVAEAGEYEISLTVADGNGTSASLTRILQVAPDSERATRATTARQQSRTGTAPSTTMGAPTPSDTSDPTTGSDSPGFGLAGAFGSVGGLAYVLRWLGGTQGE